MPGGGSEVTIEGGSPEQRALLREIVAAMGARELPPLALREHDRLAWDEFQEFGIEPTPEQIDEASGFALVLDLEGEASTRASWEGRLLANAFADRSLEQGLPRVVWHPREG